MKLAFFLRLELKKEIVFFVWVCEYLGSKMALETLTRTLRMELAVLNVEVVCCNPGHIAPTPMALHVRLLRAQKWNTHSHIK